jgi:adenylosuccinate synthase
VSPEGLHHKFSQFGSGTLAYARTHLSKHMLVEPFALWREHEILATKSYGWSWDCLSIDPEAVIITPFHWKANRLRELARGNSKHGSVGRGIGETQADAIDGVKLTAQDIRSFDDTLAILGEIQLRKLEQLKDIAWADPNLFQEIANEGCRHLATLYADLLKDVHLMITKQVLEKFISSAIVIEGSQGVLLDEHFGFAPYNTWVDTTFMSADELLDEAGFTGERERVGVLRSYHTRHGAGPFPTEDSSLKIPEPHNPKHAWMGSFRVGHFDMVAAKYACKVARPDVIALTHMDRRPSTKVAMAYYWNGHKAGMAEEMPLKEDGTPDTDILSRCWCDRQSYMLAGNLIDKIQDCTGVEVRYVSGGESADKRSELAPLAA